MLHMQKKVETIVTSFEEGYEKRGAITESPHLFLKLSISPSHTSPPS